jgi:hypothetical protein
MSAQLKPREISTEELFTQLEKNNYRINPAFVDITGSRSFGYLLTQLVFLDRHWGNETFYVKDSDLMERHRFTEWELCNGRRVLIKLGVISTQKRSDGQLSYKINKSKIVQLSQESGWGYLVEQSDISGGPAEDSSGGLPRNPRQLYKETNNKIKTIKLNNNIREKISVDNSIKQVGELFDFEKEQEKRAISYEQNFVLCKLLSDKVEKDVATRIVREFSIGEINAIIEGLQREIVRGTLRKNNAAYLVGSFNMLRKAKLAAKEAINLIGNNQTRGSNVKPPESKPFAF